MQHTRSTHSVLVLALACSSLACGSEPEPKTAHAASAAQTAPPPPPKTPMAAPPPAPRTPAAPEPDYAFQGGFPSAKTVQKAYYDADLARAVEAYRFFYPTVSWSTVFETLEQAGVTANRAAAIISADAKIVILTANSDTPYAVVPIDVHAGPMAVELPPGPLVGFVNDANQRYVMDLGLLGRDSGKSGKYLIVPRDYRGSTPKGYQTGKAATNRAIVVVRSVPLNADMESALALLRQMKVRPLQASGSVTNIDWVDLSNRELDLSPTSFESTLEYWKVLHRALNTEPPSEAYRINYGELAALGIEHGKPFSPDARMQGILEKAAKLANQQMRVQAFADRSPGRLAWSDRKWEWASLRFETGSFELPAHTDLAAREKWFFQAVGDSPAMFSRDAGAGSLYWLGARDQTGAYLNGGNTYKLSVPLPVPAKSFWSVTVYDAATRSQLRTSRGHAALRSLTELNDLGSAKSVDLYFGPSAPEGQEARWVQTQPEQGWFSYFRIYGPEQQAFDGSWKPGDFEQVK